MHWEPVDGRFAVQTVSKRESKGKTDYSNITQRFGVDLFECRIDKDTGFIVVPLGAHPSEKVVDFRWSPFGGLFCLSEKESGLSAKQIWSTFMIVASVEKV